MEAAMEVGVIDSVSTPSQHPPAWEPYHVRVGDLDIRVAHRGEGRPALLLITGIGAHLDMWGPLERALHGREIIAFDSPGAGASTRTRRPLRMGGLAKIVRDLIDTLGHDEVDVLGVSFGGALAQQLA